MVQDKNQPGTNTDRVQSTDSQVDWLESSPEKDLGVSVNERDNMSWQLQPRMPTVYPNHSMIYQIKNELMMSLLLNKCLKN